MTNDQMSEAVRQMIRRQFLGLPERVVTPERVEACAQWMSKTLRIGGIKICRTLIASALRDIQ